MAEKMKLRPQRFRSELHARVPGEVEEPGDETEEEIREQIGEDDRRDVEAEGVEGIRVGRESGADAELLASGHDARQDGPILERLEALPLEPAFFPAEVDEPDAAEAAPDVPYRGYGKADGRGPLEAHGLPALAYGEGLSRPGGEAQGEEEAEGGEELGQEEESEGEAEEGLEGVAR